MWELNYIIYVICGIYVRFPSLCVVLAETEFSVLWQGQGLTPLSRGKTIPSSKFGGSLYLYNKSSGIPVTSKIPDDKSF